MKQPIHSQQEFLQDLLNYYLPDLNRRSVKVYDEYSCCYSPKNANKDGISEGCAIGRHLEPELQEKLDTIGIETFGIQGSTVSNDSVFEKLPEWMKHLGKDFLLTTQDFHDIDMRKEINPYNKERIKNIVKDRFSIFPDINIEELTYPTPLVNE